MEGDVGGYNVDFVHKPDDSLYCPICLLVARDARQHAKCGKLFCSCCLEVYQKTCKNCPCCKRSDAMFFEDSRSNQQIKSLLVMCANQQEGCSWEGELRLFAEHASNKCQYREVECPLECGTNMKWLLVANHQKEECKNRPHECPECQQEGKYWYMTTEHMEDCPMVLTKCPNPVCEVEICAALLNYHIETECEFALVECKYRNTGCQETVRRKDLEQHENNDKYHLLVLSGTVATLHDKIEDLSSEVIALRRSINDRAKTSTKFKIEDFSIDKSVSKEVRFEASPGTYKMMASICYGQLEYGGKHIPDLQDRRRWRTSDPVGRSRKIFGSNYYPLRNNLCIAFSVMIGENDDNLHWPFSGTIKIELLNQVEDRNHYTKIVDFPSQDQIQIEQGYGRSRSSFNVIHTDDHKFISIEDLENSKDMYYPNQTLYFRITITINSPNKPWLY